MAFIMDLVAQCPCNGGGEIDPFLAVAIVIGLFGLAKWIGSVRSRKDLSGMNKAVKVGIVVLLLVIVGVMIVIKSNRPAATPNPAGSTTSANPGVLLPAGKLPRLVDLGAGKCIPCKMMAPILAELKAEYAGRLRVDVYDVWENRNIGKQFGIRMIPTQIFYVPAGKELWRHEGFMSKEDILAKWKELGVDLEGGEVGAPSR